MAPKNLKVHFTFKNDETLEASTELTSGQGE